MLVPTATGGLFAEQGGICWRLLTRVPGVTFSACRSPAQARSAGALVARFHSALADLDHEFRPIGIPLHDTAAHLAALESTLAEVGAHRLREQVEPLADEILAAALAWEDLGELPARVGHGDLKFDNLVFAGPEPPDCDRATHLIDLDTVAPRPLWTELGDAWRSWCNAAADESGARLDLALFRASCQGWGGMSELALDAAERGSLVFGLERIALELAARFTADALRESYFAWDSEHFPASGEHQLARARGQLELWRQALATRAEREALITAFVPVS
jgi:Ser/Thr protein kinase RdoA (MazF antagonist)